MTDLPFPGGGEKSPEEQLRKFKSYLFQLGERLSVALEQLETQKERTEGAIAAIKSSALRDPTANFASIKSLIIKSADIVSAYSEEIDKRLSGKYVAESNFGVYKEQTDLEIKAASDEIKGMFSHLQSVEGTIAEIQNSMISVNAHIKTGLLAYGENGAPIYGMELGQKNEINGVQVFNKYARFTPDRLSFYDSNDIEVAYIGDYRLYITNAEIKGSLQLGSYHVDTTNGLAFRWGE